ncbi:MAG: hypothetical protein H6719_32870 [Sandaracinaceae bacterium]|nr:hypothetical protein [Sandaracinaceae bacterium]
MAKAPKSRAKPDALTLWSHPGELASAMRGCKMTPKAFAAASADTLLQREGVTVELVDGVRVYSERGIEIGTLALDGDTLVLRFAAPDERPDWEQVEHCYEAVADRPGWLEFRRPATRDPRPSLEARVGALVGRAAFERAQRAQKS